MQPFLFRSQFYRWMVDQEPRFLLPIIFPVIFLHAPKLITGFCTSNPFSENSQIGEFIYQHFLCTKASANRLLKCWYATNMVLAIFFGVIHQGGVIQLTQYLHKNSISFRSDLNTNIYLLTSHLYNIPTSYLFIPSTKTLLINPANGQKYTRKKQFFLNEYGSLPMDELQKRVKLFLDIGEMRLRHEKMNNKLYLAIPSSLTEEFSVAIFKSNHTMIQYQRIETFYPHLSMEAIPQFFLHHSNEIYTNAQDFDHECNDFKDKSTETDSYSITTILRQFIAIVRQFGLVLYRIEIRHKNTFSE